MENIEEFIQNAPDELIIKSYLKAKLLEKKKKSESEVFTDLSKKIKPRIIQFIKSGRFDKLKYRHELGNISVITKDHYPISRSKYINVFKFIISSILDENRKEKFNGFLDEFNEEIKKALTYFKIKELEYKEFVEEMQKKQDESDDLENIFKKVGSDILGDPYSIETIKFDMKKNINIEKELQENFNDKKK